MASASVGAVKLVAALLTFAVGFIGVRLPFSMVKTSSNFSLANMLSAGVMLGGGVLHLLPDAAEQLQEALKAVEYPMAHLLFCLGMLLPLVIESLFDVKHTANLSLDGSSNVVSGAAHNKREQWVALEADSPVTDDGMLEPLESSADAAAAGAHCQQHTNGHRASSSTSRREVSTLSALLLLCALSFHSVLEGLAQGSATTMDATAVLLGAICLHKGLAGFSLGCLLAEARLSRQAALWLGLVFASATPLGTLVGMSLPMGEGGMVSASLVAMAGGSFTFVSLLEILPRELHDDHHGTNAGAAPKPSKGAKMAMLLLGFALMAGLGLWL